MSKVRVELSLIILGRSSKAVVVVEPTRGAVLKEAANKFKLKKKDLAEVDLFTFDSLNAPIAFPDDGSLCDGAVVVVTAGKPPPPRSHERFQDSARKLRWVEAGRGHIAARGCPVAEVLAALKELKGVSGVITLLRNGERNSASDHIRDACARLGLRWVGAPLIGWKRLVNEFVPSELSDGDPKSRKTRMQILDSCLTAREVRDVVGSDGSDRYIVHCSAGKHRTGIYFYLLLRMLGDSPECALAKMRASRPITGREFHRLKLQTWADQMLEEVSTGRAEEILQELLSEAMAGRDDIEGGVEEAEMEEDEEEEEQEEEEDEDD